MEYQNKISSSLKHHVSQSPKKKRTPFGMRLKTCTSKGGISYQL